MNRETWIPIWCIYRIAKHRQVTLNLVIHCIARWRDQLCESCVISSRRRHALSSGLPVIFFLGANQNLLRRGNDSARRKGVVCAVDLALSVAMGLSCVSVF